MDGLDVLCRVCKKNKKLDGYRLFKINVQTQIPAYQLFMNKESFIDILGYSMSRTLKSQWGPLSTYLLPHLGRGWNALHIKDNFQIPVNILDLISLSGLKKESLWGYGSKDEIIILHAHFTTTPTFTTFLEYSFVDSEIILAIPLLR